MSFHEVNLPVTIERGATGGPGFKTTITVLASGFEQRNGDWLQARGSYDISYGITTKETFREVAEFFHARRGRLFGFRFKDWSDYRLTEGEIATGDGTQTNYQITKVYADVAGTYTRPLQKIVPDTTRVFLDGAETVNFVVDTTTGVITFGSAPGPGVSITVTCEFDVPVRFESDDLSVQLQWENAGSIPSIGLIEIRQRLADLG